MTEVTRLFDLLERYKSKYKNNKNVFSHKENGQWKAYSAGEYVEMANRISSAFLNIGVKPGDKVVTVIK
ncbi:MAG: hypothetical protein U5L09_08165 [Bacteroidales bacterium]|nr:hypothetical protein [Bacteroidales bacterium]